MEKIPHTIPEEFTDGEMTRIALRWLADFSDVAQHRTVKDMEQACAALSLEQLAHLMMGIETAQGHAVRVVKMLNTEMIRRVVAAARQARG